MGRKRLIAFLLIVVLCVGISAVALTACKDTPVVTFDSAGGSAVDPVEETVSEEPVPTRDGYVFGGWYTSSTYDGERVTFPYTPEESVTLYAKWTEEAKEPTASDHLATVMNALIGQLQFDGNSQFGAEAALDIAGMSLKAAVDIDPANLGNVKAYISFENARGAISLYADDEFLYVTAPDTSKRIKGLMLADMLKGVTFPAGSDVSSALSIISAAAGLIFNDCTVNGSTYTFTGDFSALVSLAELLGITLPSSVTDLLSGVGITFEATLEGETFAGGTLTANTSLGDIAIGVDKASIANGAHPAIAVPEKDDPNFDESYALNFTAEGSATFGTSENFADTDTGVFNYEIRADFDLFGALRNAMAGGTFDASKLFDLPDSKIFIDISHICGDSCAFCENKISASRGSVLTVAYSPEDFGEKSVYIAANLANLLPKGFLEDVAGVSLGLDGIISDLLGEYVGLSIDPAALFTNSNTNTGVAAAALAGGDLSQIVPASSAGILNIIYEAVQFIGEISFTEEGGMRLSVNDLFELLESLTAVADGTNIASMLTPFFGGADYLDIKVDTAVYGDGATAGMDMYHKFMTIDENVGDYKNFVGDNYNTTPGLTYEWNKNTDGQLVYSAASSEVDMYDEEGNPLPLSADEWKQLLSGALSYDYTRADGSAGEASAQIIAVYGMDYNKVNVPQDITIVTAPADGGGMGEILGLLSMVGLQVDIPGAVAHTTVTVSGVEEVTLTQPTDGSMLNPYDADKEYYYGDLLNPYFTATIKYTDGTQKSMTLLPTNTVAISNYNAAPGGVVGDGATIDWVTDFDLVFNAFGREIRMPVNMADSQIPADQAVTEISVTTGQTLSFGYSISVQLNNAEGSLVRNTLWSRSDNDSTMTVNSTDGVTTTYNSVCFDKPGVYEVIWNVRGYEAKYKFTVTDSNVEVPGYGMNIATVDKDNFKLEVSRTDQKGSGVNTSFLVEVPGAEGGYTALAFGTDYQLYTMAGEEKQYLEEAKLFLPAFMLNPSVVYVEIVNAEYQAESVFDAAVKVTLTGDDLEGAAICSAEVNGIDLSGYGLTAQQVDNEATSPADPPEIVLSYLATVADEDKIEGMTYSVAVSASWDGGSKEGLDAKAYIKYKMEFWGTQIISYVENPAGFDFTASGTNASGEGNSGAYFLVTDSDVQAAIAAGKDVTITITVTGTLSGSSTTVTTAQVVIPGTVQA